MHTPSLVISVLHTPIIRLQQQTIMPFIMQQQLHIVPASMVHRFCRAPTAILSSAEHIIRIPPVTFSILTVQRGTMTGFMAAIGPAAGIPTPGVIVPGMVMPIGFIMVVVIVSLLEQV